MLCQWSKRLENLTLDVPGGPLSEVRDWFCAKKVVRVPNSGGGPLRAVFSTGRDIETITHLEVKCLLFLQGSETNYPLFLVCAEH